VHGRVTVQQVMMVRIRKFLLPEMSATDVDLRAISGPGDGVCVELTTEEPLLIGRDRRGLNIPDHHVSLRHCMIEWSGTAYCLYDLGSAKGTVLIGEVIRDEEGHRLRVGDEIIVGQTHYRVQDRHRNWRRAAELALLVALVGLVVGVGALVMAPRVDSELLLAWETPIRQGAFESRELRLDPSFLRQRGLDGRSLRIGAVSDHDANGLHEVWLKSDHGGWIVTFDEEGRWRSLADLPAGCRSEHRVTQGMPLLECSGVTWAFGEDRYQPIGQDGIVVWAVPSGSQPKNEIAAPHQVAVFRTTLRRKPALAGFLAMNGVDQGVHYILCERALPGVPPLARLEDGRVVSLSKKCHGFIDLHDLDVAAVRAIAFTHAGYLALLDDLETLLSGNSDGLFRPAEWDSMIEAWTRPPGAMRAVTWVGFNAADHFFDPIPPDRPLTVTTKLPTSADRTVAPHSVTATIVSQGTVDLDPPGCAQLQVVTGPWSCPIAQGCMTGSTFTTIREVGCGEPQDVLVSGYSTGVYDATVGALDLRMVTETVSRSDRIDVLRLRVAWRASSRRGG